MLKVWVEGSALAVKLVIVKVAVTDTAALGASRASLAVLAACGRGLFMSLTRSFKVSVNTSHCLPDE